MDLSCNYKFQRRVEHSNILIGDRLYSWGGGRSNMPEVHDSEEKRKLTSTVEVFDIPSLSWSGVPTSGFPPAAVRYYSSASINRTVYFFGGNCKPFDCFHNDVVSLNTKTNEWNQVLTADTGVIPMKKNGHGMLSFVCGDEQHYLLTIGGYGPTVSSTSSHSKVTPIPRSPNLSLTNESHILCVSSLPDPQWMVPVVSGTPPPPLAYFTLSALPDENRAVLFGGLVIDEAGTHRTNDTYFVSYTKDHVDFDKLSCSSNSPEARADHSSTMLTVNNNHYLLVLGGWGIDYLELGNMNCYTTSDCWLLHIEKRTWKKINVPDSVTRRYDHLISSYPVSDTCYWIIVSGGFRQYNNENKTDIPIIGSDITVIVELVYTDDEWMVTNVWDSEQLVNRKTEIQGTLIQHCVRDLIGKGSANVRDLIDNLQSTVKYSEAMKENQMLISEMEVLNSRIESYQAQLHEKDEEISVQRKMFLALTEENEHLKRERRYERKRGKDNVFVEFKKPKNSVDEMDEPALPVCDDNLKGQETEEAMEITEMGVLNSRIESYQAQLHEKDREISVQRKMFLALIEEKERLIRERRYERKRGKDDVITEFKKPKNSVDEMDEPVLPVRDDDLKGQEKEEAMEITEMPEQMKVDVGVQFNYVKRETGIDHLQGVKVFNSKLFTVHGDQPQPLIWDGHGFELHLSEGSCRPDEDCEIMVDAVVGGDFVFPKGVEPVSAIYIISITTPKLHKPSVLKIQHCVALDKASKHCHLSFYRALLKEPQPPYHFKCLKGGKFDIENQFGELELPAFCSIVIGKESSTSSYESGSDTLPVFECNSASLSSGVSDPSEEKGSSQVDDSIIYHGQAFYLQEQLNQWQFKFIVVKNLDAFREHVRSNLQGHEADLEVSLTFSESHIELVLNGEEVTNKFKGWSIRPRSVPLTLPLKRAASFGYEKEASIPPTCLMTVSGDKRVKRYSETLYYPVALKGALTGSDNQQPKVYIERTMKKKGTTNVKQPPRDRVNANKPTPATDIKKVKKCITDVINERYASLRGLIESSIEDFAAQMLSNKLITPQIQRNPSFDSIMMCFLAGFEIQDELEEVQDYCHQFFSALYDIGGQFERIADKLKKMINEKLQETMKIKLDM